MLLTTFRRDGTPVPTPVWVMPSDPDWAGTAGDELWVWANPTSGKVKRLRRSGACEVAPCSVRGVPLGRSVRAVGRVLPESSVPRVLDALARKYGLRGWFATVGPRWGFAPAGVLGIRLTCPDSAEQAPA
jgi:PPOX class probable F420-dependent enzyme